IWTSVSRVVLLTSLVVTEHINAIEIRLIQRMRLIRTALLKNQPTARLGFTAAIFLRRRVIVFWIAIQPLPCNKLSSRSIEDDVAWHREFDLLSINPSCWCWRDLRWQSHLIPKFVCLLGFIRLIALPVAGPSARLCA